MKVLLIVLAMALAFAHCNTKAEDSIIVKGISTLLGLSEFDDETDQNTNDSADLFSSKPSIFSLGEPDENNNINFSLHEIIANGGINALRKTTSTFRIDKDVVAKLNPPEDFMKVKWFSHIFTGMGCVFNDEDPVAIDLIFHPTLETSVHFKEGNTKLELSPSLKFVVGAEHALTLNLRVSVDVNLNFKVQDKNSIITGLLNVFDINNFEVASGKVNDIDIVENFNRFKSLLLDTVKSTANAKLAAGVVIPTMQLFKDVFEVNFNGVTVDFKNGFLQSVISIGVQV